MQIPKPTDADKARFRSSVPDDDGVEIKAMFGNLAAFVHGNMFMGLFGPDIGLRLSSEDADTLRAMDGAGPFGPPERPMGGYVTMPSSIVGTPDGTRWVRRALEHVASMPPKAAKPPKR